MAKTLTIRLDDFEEEQLLKVMDLHGYKTASKTISDLILSHNEILNERVLLKLKQRSCEDEIQRLKTIIENGRLSALAFSDALSQDDMFTDFSKK